MGIKKRLPGLLFASILFVAIMAVNGCSNGQNEKQASIGVPSITDNEARAMVTYYFQMQINDFTREKRVTMQSILNNAAPSFSATYVDKGQWSVAALGYGYNTGKGEWWYYYEGGLWNVYEASKIVEPNNAQARDLLKEWQGYRD